MKSAVFNVHSKLKANIIYTLSILFFFLLFFCSDKTKARCKMFMLALYAFQQKSSQNKYNKLIHQQMRHFISQHNNVTFTQISTHILHTFYTHFTQFSFAAAAFLINFTLKTEKLIKFCVLLLFCLFLHLFFVFFSFISFKPN